MGSDRYMYMRGGEEGQLGGLMPPLVGQAHVYSEWIAVGAQVEIGGLGPSMSACDCIGTCGLASSPGFAAASAEVTFDPANFRLFLRVRSKVMQLL